MTVTAARFVGIINAEYAAYARLPDAVEHATQLAELLHARHGFAPTLLPNLQRGALLDAIDLHLAAGSLQGGTLIVSWTGHGRKGADGSLRLMAPSTGADVEVAGAGQLGEWAARTGARQVLVLLDTCYSGGGLVDAVSAAKALYDGRVSAGASWFGILAVSLTDQKSRSGALASTLRRLLADGPRDPDFRWHRSRPSIRGDDLVQAVLSEWDEPRHTPYPMLFGRAWDLVRNPLHRAVPDQPLEHLLRAARSSAGEESFFTGRERALARLVAWLARELPGLFVVTGPPGCGKSALVGRIVSLSSSAERARLLRAGAVPAEFDPGEASVHAQLQAHGATVDSAAEDLAQQLGLEPGQGLFGVLGAARQRRNAGKPFAIAIDGLDEAGRFSRELISELLQPLARDARVIVATRDLAFEDQSLVALLGTDAERLDLGLDPDTLEDVRRYVMHRIVGVDPALDPALVADELKHGGATSAAPFLLARIITSQVREHPIDTSAEGWRAALATTVENALERDLQSVILVIDGKPHPTAARELLYALSLAHGGGFPADDVWPAVASALSWSGTPYGRADAYAAVAALGRHVVASSEGGQLAYRIAHGRLAEYLTAAAASRRARSSVAAPEPAIATAIADLYDELLDSGIEPRAHAYLWRYAWRHLAVAGEPGLERLERLAARDAAAFDSDLAIGYAYAGTEAVTAARAHDAIALHEKSVAAGRRLGASPILVRSLFHLSIARSMIGDDEGTDAAAAEAVRIARSLPSDAVGRSALGSALLARALAQNRDGNFKGARRLSAEIIALTEGVERDEEARRTINSAHLIAAQCCVALLETDEAARAARLALAALDERDADQATPSYIETHALLAAVNWLQATAAQPGPSGQFAPVDSAAGEHIWQLHQAAGARGDIRDTSTGKALLFLARSRLLDAVRGVVPHEPAAVTELLDAASELLEPHAERIADAAVIYAGALLMRASLEAAVPPRALELLGDAVAVLRRFAAGSVMIGIELGVYIDVMVSVELAQPDHGARRDALIALEQEAVSLLRRAQNPVHRAVLAQASMRLADLLQATAPERSNAAREEAVNALRAVAKTTHDRIRLAGILVDHAGSLSDTRPVEAVDAAREALSLLASVPANPLTEFLTAAAESNLAAVHMMPGTENAEARTLLQRVIARLDHSPVPHAAAVLGNAYANLARVELEARNFEEAVALASRACELLEQPAIPVAVKANRLLAQVTLGRAQLALGRTEHGNATLAQVADGLKEAVAKQLDVVDKIVTQLGSVAPELFEQALALLRDDPARVRRLELMRSRPKHELALTVTALLAALADANGGALREVREIARHHRAFDDAEFDRLWREATGELPRWLLIKPELARLVIAFWNAPTWEISRDYLAAHESLLDPDTDVLIDELTFGAAERSLADQHLDLLAAARRDGAAAAYAPLLLRIEIGAWLHSDDPREHALQHPELLRPEVLTSLETDGAARSLLFASIVRLCQRGEQDLAFDIYDRPDEAVQHLRPAWRARDAGRLEALATIIFWATKTEPVRRKALTALALADAFQHEPLDTESKAAAMLTAAGPDERAALTEYVTDAIAHHPRAAADLACVLALWSDDSPAPVA